MHVHMKIIFSHTCSNRDAPAASVRSCKRGNKLAASPQWTLQCEGPWLVPGGKGTKTRAGQLH